jgi:hypothetical protein
MIQGRSGTAYSASVFTFLDSDDPVSDLFGTVKVRPVGRRLVRSADAGFVVAAESRVWDRGEIVGAVPSRGPG